MVENTLHIYGQKEWHDTIYVCGDDDALLLLRNAVDAAMKSPKGIGIAASFTNDGEGYDVIVRRMEPAEMDAMATPYTDELAADHRASAKRPWDLEL